MSSPEGLQCNTGGSLRQGADVESLVVTVAAATFDRCDEFPLTEVGKSPLLGQPLRPPAVRQPPRCRLRTCQGDIVTVTACTANARHYPGAVMRILSRGGALFGEIR